MELKTLKDILSEALPEELIGKSTDKIIKALIKRERQEAIKWVKELRFRIQNGFPLQKYRDQEEGIEGWIIQFFNLTEEELKDG